MSNRWKYTVHGVKDAINDDDLGFEETRDRVVSALRASAWFRSADEYHDLPDLVEDLAETVEVEEFDAVLGAIYDGADYDRAWIA